MTAEMAIPLIAVAASLLCLLAIVAESGSSATGAIMSYQHWRFYGLIGGCLLAAGILVALMLGGEVAGPRVAETPSHQSRHE